MAGAVELDEHKLRRLKECLEGIPEVELAAIVGSLASRGYSQHGVDVAVKGGGDKYECILRVVDGVARALNLDPEVIDVIDLDRADPEFKRGLVESGIVLVDQGLLKEVVREVVQLYPEYHEYRAMSIREWLSSRDLASIDLDLVKRRLDFLEQYVLSRSVDEVKSSPTLKRLLEQSYQLTVEAVVDTCRHIVSARG